jgi:hypothetical protein
MVSHPDGRRIGIYLLHLENSHVYFLMTMKMRTRCDTHNTVVDPMNRQSFIANLHEGLSFLSRLTGQLNIGALGHADLNNRISLRDVTSSDEDAFANMEGRADMAITVGIFHLYVGDAFGGTLGVQCEFRTAFEGAARS